MIPIYHRDSGPLTLYFFDLLDLEVIFWSLKPKDYATGNPNTLSLKFNQ